MGINGMRSRITGENKINSITRGDEKIMKKKIFLRILLTSLSALCLFTGCSGKTGQTEYGGEEQTPAPEDIIRIT